MTVPPPSERDRAIRLEIYRHFAETGAAPDPAGLARAFGISTDALDDAYRRLAAAREIVLRADAPTLLMAHPFSATPTAYVVHAGGRRYYANCAWDALSISPALRRDSTSIAACAQTGEALRFDVRNGALQPAPGVVHFLVPPLDFWRDIAYT